MGPGCRKVASLRSNGRSHTLDRLLFPDHNIKTQRFRALSNSCGKFIDEGEKCRHRCLGGKLHTNSTCTLQQHILADGTSQESQNPLYPAKSILYERKEVLNLADPMFCGSILLMVHNDLRCSSTKPALRMSHSRAVAFIHTM